MQPPLAKSTMSLNLLGSAGQQWQTAKSGASTTQSPSSPPMQRCGVLSLPEVCLCTWNFCRLCNARLLFMNCLSLQCRPCWAHDAWPVNLLHTMLDVGFWFVCGYCRSFLKCKDICTDGCELTHLSRAEYHCYPSHHRSHQAGTYALATAHVQMK